MRRLSTGAALVIAIVMAACSPLGETPSPSAATQGPQSPSIDALDWFVDDKYGFAMLRPTNWESIDLGQSRGFIRPAEPRYTLQAVNYAALPSPDPDPQHSSVGGAYPQLDLFRASPDLAGWAAGIERLWASNDVPFRAIASQPRTRIYALEPDAEVLQVVALVVDDAQPITVALIAPDSTIEGLRVDGLLDDFATMAESVAVP